MRAPSLCLAETIMSLIEMKTIETRTYTLLAAEVRGTKRARREHGRRLSSFYCSQIECRFSPPFLAGSRKRSKSEGRFPRSIYQNASGCAASSPSRRSLRAHTTTKLSSRCRIRYPVLLRACRCARPFLFTMRHPRKGTWGSAVYLHGGYASTRICSRTRAPATVPLIL